MADKLSKFNIKGTLADVIDAEARASIAELTEDVTTAQNTADGAQRAAEGAQSAAEAAQGTANDALNGLTGKQNNLTKWGNFSGNIDDLYGDTGESWQSNGVYFCDASNITGTLPYSSGFFTLIVLRNIQIAFPYKTPANDTSAATVKFRDHTNGWRLWRGASFTV